jgi:hypothetical protein
VDEEKEVEVEEEEERREWGEPGDMREKEPKSEALRERGIPCAPGVPT